MEKPQFKTIAQTAKTLNISRPTIYRRIKSGEIPYTRLGRRVLIPEAFFEGLISQAMSGTQPAVPAGPMGA